MHKMVPFPLVLFAYLFINGSAVFLWGILFSGFCELSGLCYLCEMNWKTAILFHALEWFIEHEKHRGEMAVYE